MKALWTAYRLRWRRRKYLWRAHRKQKQLRCLQDATGKIAKDDILLFSTLRNEIERLPYFLEHYRKMGIGQFLIVDNGSDDGSDRFLMAQPDVSLWQTKDSYRKSRFGVDWLNGLQRRFGVGHWCLTADADELLVIPHGETRDLTDLTAHLDRSGATCFAAMMLDCYPKGPVGAAEHRPGVDPMAFIGWFDAEGYTWEWQQKFRNISIRGGPRRRFFFADTPDMAPHLHKTPLVKWRASYAYASSTHLLLPRQLNHGFDARLNRPTGVFLHTKFLNTIVQKSAQERQRAEHFTHPDHYAAYYKGLIEDPDFWTHASVRYGNPQQLVTLGLMTAGDWS